MSLIQLNRALEDKVNQKPSSLNRASEVAANSICHLGSNSLPYPLQSTAVVSNSNREIPLIAGIVTCNLDESLIKKRMLTMKKTIRNRTH